MPQERSREVLPIPDRRDVSAPTYEATEEDVDYEPIQPLLPPAGSPNILLVLLDDAGFGSSSTFGGPCRTPTFDRLAAPGRCRSRATSPSTSALTSGRGSRRDPWQTAPRSMSPPRARVAYPGSDRRDGVGQRMQPAAGGRPSSVRRREEDRDACLPADRPGKRRRARGR